MGPPSAFPSQARLGQGQPTSVLFRVLRKAGAKGEQKQTWEVTHALLPTLACVRHGLSQQGLYNLPVDIRQPEVTALRFICQLGVVDA